MSALLDVVLDSVVADFKLAEPEWGMAIAKKDELAFLDKECNTDSVFDPNNTRKLLYMSMINGGAHIIVNRCEYGRVIAIFDNAEQVKEVPWGLWGRILRMYSEKADVLFKVYFLANTHVREFPLGGRPIKPENINGGYTYRCDKETIVIYRAEDATRVLIHELQHACCLDKDNVGLDIMEAETEAWAELLYVALLSEGNRFIFRDLLREQSEWMVKQNNKVRKHMKHPYSMEFPWRYTIGKEDVWRRWNILDYEEGDAGHVRVGTSLRLTRPPNATLKRAFNVTHDSMML